MCVSMFMLMFSSPSHHIGTAVNIANIPSDIAPHPNRYSTSPTQSGPRDTPQIDTCSGVRIFVPWLPWVPEVAGALL
ncbi:hypothetical protein N7504_011061 [Penicillium tannophilum]|nr:hypothetical protein N7504_011061 [Penicillium tannophilum]